MFGTAEFDGSASLWSAESRSAVAHFNKPTVETWKTGHTSRVRFTEDGTRFLACDTAGQLIRWDITNESPDSSQVCHTKRATDIAVLDFQGRIVATAGQSIHSENLALWDLSAPPRSRRLTSVVCSHGTAAYSLAFFEDQQCLVVGGGAGQLGIFDLRQRVMMLEDEGVHSKAVRALAVHPCMGKYLASGSTDGTVKLLAWKNGKLDTYAHLIGMHPTHTLVSSATSDSMISQRGVTDLCLSFDFLFSCGADGTAKMTPLSSLMM